MDDKKIIELLTLYDEYINSLKHISTLNINVNEANRINDFTSPRDMESFLNFNINEAHNQYIEYIVNNMLGKSIGLSDVRNLRTYIHYPDFLVRTHLNNPANIFNDCRSLERAIIISPTYELNLVMDGNKICGKSNVLRIRRLVISPSVNVISYVQDSVDDFTLNCILNELAKKFAIKYKGEPNKDDLVLLRNLALKYYFEEVKSDLVVELDLFTKGTSEVSYNYMESKDKICNKYNVYFRDNYRSKSDVTCPWIFKQLLSFDNREIIGSSDLIVPLAYMRTKK